MGKRILVADSDSVVQQVASYFLKLEGFDVEAVGDGVSAMEAIERMMPDAIVMTPVLSGINGVEVSYFVREKPQYKNIPVIFLAESEEPLLNNVPDLSRQFGIVTKPIDPTQLVNTIKEHLEKGPAASEEIRESLKSIEELLGWEVSDKKMVKSKEEIVQGKSMERSYDVTEMLAGNIHVPEKDPSVHPEASLTDEIPCPECSSESQTMPGQETPKQVRDERHDGGEGGYQTAEDREAELKSRITDDRIEEMVRKIAGDIVERLAREIVPDIAEREITKEIERLKGTE